MSPEAAQRDGLRAGHIVALTGALVALGSLWAPWLKLAAGPALLTGWQMFNGADIAAAVGAGAVILILFAATGMFGAFVLELQSAARLALLIGVVGALWAVHGLMWDTWYGPAFTWVDVPVGAHIGWGAYAGLAGWVAVVVGSVWAAVVMAPGDPRALDGLFDDLVEELTGL